MAANWHFWSKFGENQKRDKSGTDKDIELKSKYVVSINAVCK